MNTQKKKVWLFAGIALVLVAVMAAAWFTLGPKGTAGQKNISVTVVYADASTDKFDISTDAEFLRGALEEQNFIAGDENEYGLFVKTVNGVTADDANQEWWSFSKDGESLMTGVDSTPIADGDAFEITLMIGW
ncbi:MAG: DUF4430 domain-containing protein [Subdoligranulum sp.]|nr:DUF4430 domain-containing protein [Subdoligranulum sp.]